MSSATINSAYSTTGTTASTTTSTTSSNSSLTFDQFLSLLTTELQYQDPTDPVDATEYVSQMAQVSSLQELSNVYTAVSNNSAYNMIDKQVAYSTTDTSGNTVTGIGTVVSIVQSGSSTYVNVGGTLVNLEDITEVASSSASVSTDES